MKPQNLPTNIFLDSGDPQETKEIISLLGWLDGQTTNPSLVAKNPDAERRLAEGDKFSKGEVYGFYRSIVEKISALIPRGSVSIEVYADEHTTAEDMVVQGKEMYAWVPNAHIKLPITAAGLTAAEIMVRQGMRVNMTLCFSQAQAAAVYAATRVAKKGQVFISPFDGRLDDQHEHGMDLIKNIQKMYGAGDGHVEVLVASIRNVNHLMYSLYLKTDIITVPASILKDWAVLGMPIPDHMPDVEEAVRGGEHIAYEEYNLEQAWQTFMIEHPLTAKGIARFAADWNKLTKE